MPKLRHPDSKQTIEPSPDQAPLYEAQGWRRVQAKRQPKPPSSK